MTQRHTFRIATAAALAAFAALGAQAQEGTQWVPDQVAMTTSSPDAMTTPNAWTTSEVAATQFHDGMSRDTMATRESVKAQLRQAREKHLLNDTGEAGATDRVLAAREAFIEEERDRLVAMQTEDDALTAMIESMSVTDDWIGDSYQTAGLFEYDAVQG